MHAPAPPKKARGELASKTARKLIAGVHYATLALLSNTFGSRFGFLSSADGGSRIGSRTRVCGHE
jgi:hypothetical protein